MPHLSPTEPGEKPPARHTQADKWAINPRAARQFHARERSLQVPRKHVEELTEPDGTVIEVQLGQFVDNTRRRADKLNQDRRAELDALGIRWYCFGTGNEQHRRCPQDNLDSRARGLPGGLRRP
ncbi:helicase associated domain-containing protein [Actinacidiphila glaucinigra]|uniref:helicase associated domain-containing protein n=1 Tax=Actinacidiphila glaucinigra TaxID=235986 RepID=UPI0033A2F32F